MGSSRERATFETTKRLLFHIVNEGLSHATIQHFNSGEERWLCLQKDCIPLEDNVSRVRVSICPSAVVDTRYGQVISLRHPDNLAPPVVLEQGIQGSLKSWTDLDPGSLFDFMYPWFEKYNDQNIRAQIIRDLRNSAANQGQTRV